MLFFILYSNFQVSSTFGSNPRCVTVRKIRKTPNFRFHGEEETVITFHMPRYKTERKIRNPQYLAILYKWKTADRIEAGFPLKIRLKRAGNMPEFMHWLR